MLSLKPHATLSDFQQYVRQMEIERGFSYEGPLEKCLLLGEEVGELFKAIRKAHGVAIGSNSKVGSIAHELADVFIYVLAIANKYDVDLEAAFLEKEEENKKRKWEPNGG